MCFMVLGKVSKIKKNSGKFHKGSDPPLLVEQFLLAKNDLHVMKQILYDMGPQVVVRWSLERILKLSKSVLVKRPPTPPKNGKKISLS